MASTCKVTGSLAALPGMDAAAICGRFESDLAAALGTAHSPQGLAITLTLHPRGAIDARITRAGDGAAQTLPVISVDALDRGLRPDDITQLARAAAQALADAASDPSSRPAAHLEGN